MMMWSVEAGDLHSHACLALWGSPTREEAMGFSQDDCDSLVNNALPC